MKHKQWTVLLFSVCLLINVPLLADNTSPAVTSELPFSAGETLHYTLSYQGLLTSMLQADIADAKMTFLANRQTPNNENGYQFVLQLSTENYTKAELIQPVRYIYTTTLDETLQRTLLVEEVDNGENQSHDFLWLDWQNKETQLFKKREKELLSSDLFGLKKKEVWEKDGEQKVPEFLNNFPLLENNQSYLIHKESGDKIKRRKILDPLSMIYMLRTFDFSSKKEVAIAVSDDIRLYRIEKTGIETLKVGKNNYQTTRYKIHTDEKKDKSFYVWLNNDKHKIPLRFMMQAPLGRLEVDLIKVSQMGGNKLPELVDIGD